MAQVPYSDGIASVAPSSDPPQDSLRVQASPGAFGAAIGQGLEQLGEGAAHASHVWGQVQTSDAINNAESTANDLVSKYRTLRGADALNQREDFEKQIEDTFKNARQGLKLTDQQFAFDQSARAFKERYVAGLIRSHADTQAHEFAQATNNSTYSTGMAMIGANPNDDDAFSLGVEKMHRARVLNANLNGLGGDPDYMENETRQTAIDATEARIKALLASPKQADLVQAKAILEANRPLLATSKSYDTFASTVENTVDKGTANQEAQKYLGDMIPGYGGSPKSARAHTLMDEATALQKIDQDYRDDPKMGRLVAQQVKETYAITKMTEQARLIERQEAISSTVRQLGDAIYANPTAPIEQSLAAHPELSQEQVEHLRNYRESALNEKLHGKPGDYGPGYADVQSRIFSTTGPNRIINQEQLLALASGPNASLNPAGYQEASKLLGEVNKPGAEADRELQRNFFNSARQKITLAMEGEHEVIPGSTQKWNRALPLLTKALEEGRAKGIPNSELMNPDSKQSVWSAVTPFLPTANEQMSAEINRDDQQVKKAGDWQKIDKFEDAQAAYLRHDITRDQAKVLWNKNGWGKATNGPQVPTGGSAFERNSQYAEPGPYITKLSPEQETEFQSWVKDNKVPFDPSAKADYDMRGFWKALKSGDPSAKQDLNPNDHQMHFPDIWKTPYHQSFSDESKYAKSGAPHWANDHQLVDKDGRVVFDEARR